MQKHHQNKPESTQQAGNMKRKAIAAAGAYLPDNRPQTVMQRKQAEALANYRLATAPVQKKQNGTGLPDKLKNGIEHLSGHPMDDVKVHYNSSKPTQLHAHAYAQGSQIHLAPGQQKHLPHEAWHVAQQKQGRVKPTLQLKNKVNINDDASLEQEADLMGAKAMSTSAVAQPKFAGSLQANLAGTIQKMAVVPKLADGTELDYERMSPSNDDQAPVRIAEYRFTAAPVATQENALLHIRDLYAEIGTGLQGDPLFLSRGSLRTYAYGNAANAPRVYNVLLNNGSVPAQIPATNQQKINTYRPVLGDPSPARQNLRLFLDNPDIHLKDPLKVVISVPHGTGTLTATVTFTEAFRGYVTGMHEVAGGGGAPLINATLERRDTYGEATHTATTPIATFSGTHHLTGTRTAQEEIALAHTGNTHYQQERGVDAMTKVIAEGGRFQCVNELGTSIKNSTRFYAEKPGYGDQDTIYPYVTFAELYRLWTLEFGARYKIPNSEVVDYLISNADRLPHMTDETLLARPNAVSVDE
ncbi:DUF4157 domain-containing protein [Mucilaginibacter celer]|uniref:DUF4157 domain-containing protein n=1 Tax=Mucilaginibacter celer TaxID=2305508 RepID=A0A494VZL2_9SPHI|nr:DUF4157 domain-containing protein [Mucilaginibacter celer]AYL96943.1 DUF4157 domain-containing protein [Mucilaginibacter celer]